MKKKIAAALGIVAVLVMMVLLPPPEWAGAQSGPNHHASVSPVKSCLYLLEGGRLSTFAACVINLTKTGEI